MPFIYLFHIFSLASNRIVKPAGDFAYKHFTFDAFISFKKKTKSIRKKQINTFRYFKTGADVSTKLFLTFYFLRENKPLLDDSREGKE